MSNQYTGSISYIQGIGGSGGGSDTITSNALTLDGFNLKSSVNNFDSNIVQVQPLLSSPIVGDLLTVNSSGLIQNSGYKVSNIIDSSTTNLSTTYAVQQAISNALSGSGIFIGGYDASGDTYPTTGSGTSGAVMKGDWWTITTQGTLGGVTAPVGSTLRASIDSPGQTSSNWVLTSNGVTSFNGRQGLVFPAINDYSIAQITNGLSNILTKGMFYQGDDTDTAVAVAPGSLTELTSSVLTITGGTDSLLSDVSIQVKLASTTQSGYVSSTSYNTFNNKQRANISNISISNGVTTVLSSSSNYFLYVSGTAAYLTPAYIQLPDATTMTNGDGFWIHQTSSSESHIGIVDNSNTIILVSQSVKYIKIVLVDNSTSDGTWAIETNISNVNTLNAQYIGAGTVSNTSFGYLRNVNSDIQGQLNDLSDVAFSVANNEMTQPANYNFNFTKTNINTDNYIITGSSNSANISNTYWSMVGNTSGSGSSVNTLFEIIRSTTNSANGSTTLLHNGTGDFFIKAAGAAYIKLQTSGASRVRISDSLTEVLNGLSGATASFSGVLAVTGATTLGSTLAVSGVSSLSSATLSSTLAVSGATTLNSTLAVSGDAIYSGKITVNGAIKSTSSSNQFILGSDSINIMNISCPTITGTRTFTLPDANCNPVVPSTASTNQFATGISSAGVVSYAQPAFSNLSGSAAASQMPALTGDVTTIAGNVATTITDSAITTAKIANNAITLAKMATIATATVLGNISGATAVPSALTLSSTGIASAITQYDSNGNLNANAFIPDYSFIVSNLTLTVSSNQINYLSSTTTTVTLPDATTLKAGQYYILMNYTTNDISVNLATATNYITLKPGNSVTVICVSTASIAGTWANTGAGLWYLSSSVLLPSSNYSVNITRTDTFSSVLTIGNTNVSNTTSSAFNIADATYAIAVATQRSYDGYTTILHRSTNDFAIKAQDNARIKFYTNNTLVATFGKNGESTDFVQTITSPMVAAGGTSPSAALHVTGGVIFTRTAVSASYTVLTTDYIIAVTSTAASRTITLPSSHIAGKIYIVKDESGGANTNNITVSGNGSNIDGTSTKVINTAYGYYNIYDNGTNYFIF